MRARVYEPKPALRAAMRERRACSRTERLAAVGEPRAVLCPLQNLRARQLIHQFARRPAD